MQDKEQKAGIVLDEKLVGIWFLGLSDKSDWMAGLTEVTPDEKYELKYRFRYHEDDKIFDSADRKNWYEGIVTGTRNYCILSMRSIGKRLEEKAQGQLYELLNDTGDPNDFRREYMKLPFVFARMEKQS
jgi:hypothetical protein